MFSYRWMGMEMDGMLQGSTAWSTDEVHQNYMVAPESMRMNMHMLGLMYAPSDKLSFMIMVPHLSREMSSQPKMGESFAMSSTGWGDMTVTGITQLYTSGTHRLLGSLGLSIPTGNINQRGQMPMMPEATLAYPMQLGSGTLDPIATLTYAAHAAPWTWGAQFRGIWRLYENSDSYRRGSESTLTAWTGYRIHQAIGLTARVHYRHQGQIQGQHPDFNPMMMPLYNTANSGGELLGAGLGVNGYLPLGHHRHVKLGVEVQYPLHTRVNGLQMKPGGQVMCGVTVSM